MKHIQRPHQIKLPERYIVSNGDDFRALDKVWKQLVREMREENRNHMFAPLSILRNLMLGRDMYTGFTPALKLNCLKNGRGFTDGFSSALRELRVAADGERMTHLATAFNRMVLAIHLWPRVGELKRANIFPADHIFVCNDWHDGYMARVQKMIIRMQDEGHVMQGKTFAELFDMFDSNDQYNLIREDEWLKIKNNQPKVDDLLRSFANDLIGVDSRMETSKLLSVKVLKDFPSWMYIDENGVDQRPENQDEEQIEITTVPKYASNRIDGKFYFPVSYLWETEWLKEYNR